MKIGPWIIVWAGWWNAPRPTSAPPPDIRLHCAFCGKHWWNGGEEKCPECESGNIRPVGGGQRK